MKLSKVKVSRPISSGSPPCLEHMGNPLAPSWARPSVYGIWGAPRPNWNSHDLFFNGRAHNHPIRQNQNTNTMCDCVCVFRTVALLLDINVTYPSSLHSHFARTKTRKCHKVNRQWCSIQKITVI